MVVTLSMSICPTHMLKQDDAKVGTLGHCLESFYHRGFTASTSLWPYGCLSSLEGGESEFSLLKFTAKGRFPS